MRKVTRLRDIEAPCEEVFNTVVDIHKRMQLSPLWGISQLLHVSEDYPAAGSRYRIRVLPGAPFGLSQGTLNAPQSALAGLAEVLLLRFGMTSPVNAAEGRHPQAIEKPKDEAVPIEHDYFVVECVPVEKFVYQLDEDRKTLITWRFRHIPLGTRITYEECFSDERAALENFIPALNQVIKEWLTNLKRYCELRGSWWRKLIKWWLDRFYLKLRPDQRRVVLLLLVMQAVGLGTFLIAAIIWGIPQLFF